MLPLQWHKKVKRRQYNFTDCKGEFSSKWGRIALSLYHVTFVHTRLLIPLIHTNSQDHFICVWSKPIYITITTADFRRKFASLCGPGHWVHKYGEQLFCKLQTAKDGCKVQKIKKKAGNNYHQHKFFSGYICYLNIFIEWRQCLKLKILAKHHCYNRTILHTILWWKYKHFLLKSVTNVKYEYINCANF